MVVVRTNTNCMCNANYVGSLLSSTITHNMHNCTCVSSKDSFLEDTCSSAGETWQKVICSRNYLLPHPLLHFPPKYELNWPKDTHAYVHTYVYIRTCHNVCMHKVCIRTYICTYIAVKQMKVVISASNLSKNVCPSKRYLPPLPPLTHILILIYII